MYMLTYVSRFGRDNFQEALKMVTTASTEGVDWSRFKYIVFDVPQDVGSYEQRYSMLGENNFYCAL